MLIALIAVAVGLVCFSLGLLVGLIVAYLFLEAFVDLTGIGEVDEAPKAEVEGPAPDA